MVYLIRNCSADLSMTWLITHLKICTYFILEELALSGHEKHHKSWKDDFEKVIKQFILPEIPCYVLYR